MPCPEERRMCVLNDGYSIDAIETSTGELKIDLYFDGAVVYGALLNDRQCSRMTHQFCETTKELYSLLMDRLTSAGESDVRVLETKAIEISFPVSFGREKSCTKIWSVTIQLTPVPSTANESEKDVSLDPSDWTEMRSLGQRVMGDMIDYLQDLRHRSTWRPMPAAVRSAIAQSEIPWKGQSPCEVYDEVRSLVLPYGIGNIHPNYWGYVQGTGSSMGALAELITGTMNTMSWGGHQSSIHIERQVLSWLKVLMDFPNDESSSGVLVSGTSVATIIALAVARKRFVHRTMKIYCSKEVHNCLTRAVDLLNIGRDNVVLIPTNAERQIDIKALESVLDSDSCGVVIGTAGIVGTGAIDDLDSLGKICAERPNDLWFHIDGAIGAVARCSARLRPLLSGFHRADSVAFDLHKWLFVPYECGCILIRDGQLHRSTFSQPAASYLTLMKGGLTPSEGETFFSDYGLELSRGMKSLKVWMTLKTYGLETFGKIMEKNVDQVQYFARLIEQHAEQFEVLVTGPLNIVCFRYIVSRSHPVDPTVLNRINKELLVAVQERGFAVVSPLVINSDTFALRMCITNHRTRYADLDLFMRRLIELAEEFLKSPEYAFLTIE